MKKILIGIVIAAAAVMILRAAATLGLIGIMLFGSAAGISLHGLYRILRGDGREDF